MKLAAAVNRYVSYRQSLGERFTTNAKMLVAFIRALDKGIKLKDVKPESVGKYLAGTVPAITTNWYCKYQALRGFYRYVLGRGYVKVSPLPVVIPKRPPPFIPYIYNVEELRALLHACSCYQKSAGLLESYMTRTLLLLLYGTGLRIGEAVSLTLADVDLNRKVLTVRETKFFKTRLVPLGKQLTEMLLQYSKQRQENNHPQNPESPFFIGRSGKAIKQHTFCGAFQIIRKTAGVRRTDGARYQPRIHDLRHTFAVHRLTTWYKAGADVQRLLPILSVYLGHAYLASTSTYLTMTPALLEQAGRRFQQYASKEISHD